jgi:hypothetical protein
MSATTETSFWRVLPLAVALWLALLWGLGWLLQTPPVKPSPVTAIDARLVELPEKKPAPVAKPRAQPAPKPRPRSTPKVLVKQPVLRTPSAPPPPPPPAAVKPTEPAPPPTEAAPTDMQSYVKAAQARRHAAETTATGVAESHAPSADEQRLETIRRNLQPVGTNGIFQILDLQVRTARFSFRAWTSNASNPRRETIDVDAGAGGNIELAVIRRMIELIRGYYKGDFNWESDRLGRVVVLSARQVDNAELEDFMMREFFGVGAKNQTH